MCKRVLAVELAKGGKITENCKENQGKGPLCKYFSCSRGVSVKPLCHLALAMAVASQEERGGAQGPQSSSPRTSRPGPPRDRAYTSPGELSLGLASSFAPHPNPSLTETGHGRRALPRRLEPRLDQPATSQAPPCPSPRPRARNRREKPRAACIDAVPLRARTAPATDSGHLRPRLASPPLRTRQG